MPTARFSRSRSNGSTVVRGSGAMMRAAVRRCRPDAGTTDGRLEKGPDAMDGLETSAVAAPLRPAGAPTRGAPWRVWAMVGGTLLAAAALLSQLPSLSVLWDTVRDANWWWILLAVVFTLGNKVGYAL